MANYSATSQFPAPSLFATAKKTSTPWTSRARAGGSGTTGAGAGTGTTPTTPGTAAKTSGQLWPRS